MVSVDVIEGRGGGRSALKTIESNSLLVAILDKLVISIGLDDGTEVSARSGAHDEPLLHKSF